MKRLTISRLMDEYTDTEFFPAGGSAADPEAVKGLVLANIKAPAGRKRMPAKKKALLAAALAAVLVVLVGAGFPSRLYRLATGSVEFYRDADSRTISYKGEAAPLELEDGKLFYVLDGEHVDTAGLMDRDTPYILDLSDPAENMTCYLIMGGTPERFGWFEWMVVPDPFDQQEEDCVIPVGEDGRLYNYHFGFTTAEAGEEPYRSGGSGVGNPDWASFTEDLKLNEADFRWLRAAADQLGIPFVDTTGQPKTIIRD